VLARARIGRRIRWWTGYRRLFDALRQAGQGGRLQCGRATIADLATLHLTKQVSQGVVDLLGAGHDLRDAVGQFGDDPLAVLPHRLGLPGRRVGWQAAVDYLAGVIDGKAVGAR
jgi:hypothetical protein